MNYDSIIIELISRVQKLELEVKELREERSKQNNEIGKTESLKKVSDTQRAKDYIKLQMDNARDKGQSEIILKAGDIQKDLGIKNRPAVICNAMKQMMQENDEILEAPPSGLSTKVLIKYYL